MLLMALPTALFKAAVPTGLFKARFRLSTCHMYRQELSFCTVLLSNSRRVFPTAWAAVPTRLLKARFRLSTCHMCKQELSFLHCVANTMNITLLGQQHASAVAWQHTAGYLDSCVPAQAAAGLPCRYPLLTYCLF